MVQLNKGGVVLPEYEPVVFDDTTEKYYFFDETKNSLIGPYDTDKQAQHFSTLYFSKGNYHVKKRMTKIPIDWNGK